MKGFCKGIFLVSILGLCVLPVAALPQAEELSVRELVGQTIMPRLIIGKHHAFKEPILNGEVTGFFIKTHEGVLNHPHITAANQAKFIKKQRKKLRNTLKDLQKWTAKSKHQIPLLLTIDYEGGTVTSPMYLGLKQMPSNMLLAATQDPLLIQTAYEQEAREIRRVGANMALGPVTDVNSNPQNPIIQTRSFGDDSVAVGQYSAWAVDGLQSNGVPAVLKHFPGHGDTLEDSHFTQPITDLPPDVLWQHHISAFVPPILAGSAGVMTNHVIYPQLDAQNAAMFSSVITQDLLRGRLDFNGLVFTDALDMRGVGGKNIHDVVLDGYHAGNDILLLTSTARNVKLSAVYPHLAGMWTEEEIYKPHPRITQEVLKTRVQKILDFKQKILDTPPFDFQADDETEFEKISRQAAEKGVTWVRGNIKPFEQGQKVCAVFFAEPIFSAQVARFNEILLQNGVDVSFVHGSYTPTEKDAKKIESCLEGAHTLVLGTSRRGAMNKPQYELATDLLNRARDAQQETVLISLLNPYEIPSYPQAQTVLALYGPTVHTVEVAAEILLGLRPAQGVLPIHF